jgi:phytoene desaturase
MARVLVVGAGLAGLSTAVRLAAGGHDVTVLEQSASTGGKAGWWQHDGFGFDTGPSLLTLPDVYRELFAETGTALEQHLQLVEVEPACHYRFADGAEVDVPGAGTERLRAALDDALGPGAGDQWVGLLTRGGEIWDATREPFLGSPLRGARTLARYAIRVDDLRTVAPWLSLRELGRRYLKHPHLRTMLDRYATYTGSDPRRAPAALATVPYVEHAFGSWYVGGGLHQLVRAVSTRAEQLGVTVRTGTDVSSVLLDGARATGVVLAGDERVAGDVVVSAVDAAHLVRDLLPSRLTGRVAPGLRRGTPSLSGFVLLLALRGRTPNLRHHTVLFGGDYDDEFDSVFGTGRHARRPEPVADPTVYISSPDDPATRPDADHEAWFVLVNAPRHSPKDPRSGVDWRSPGLADSYADHVLDVLAARGLDVRHRVLWRDVRTPADLEQATRSVGGSIYGSSSNGSRAAFLRPANASGIRGLYLVGGSAHPGGGLPLVGMSARIVADLIGPA